MVKELKVNDGTIADVEEDVVVIKQRVKGTDTFVSVRLTKQELAELANRVKYPIFDLKKCVHCEEIASPATPLMNYPSGKVAHLECHIENNGGEM